LKLFGFGLWFFEQARLFPGLLNAAAGDIELAGLDLYADELAA
jgi:hypothetical protein